jgi:DHA1 family tetracycline resistance protein-like MFS transporter
MKSNKNSTLIFIIVVVVIDTAGFGLIFPVLPQLLNNLLHSDILLKKGDKKMYKFKYA